MCKYHGWGPTTNDNIYSRGVYFKFLQYVCLVQLLIVVRTYLLNILDAHFVNVCLSFFCLLRRFACRFSMLVSLLVIRPTTTARPTSGPDLGTYLYVCDSK